MTTTTVSTTYESTIRRLYQEVVNLDHPEVADEIVADDFVVHGDGTEAADPIVGPDAFRAGARLLKQACPDFAIHVQEVLGDGDRVAVRWTSSGTHTLPFMGAEPTGRRVGHWGIVIYRFRDEKLAEMWPMVDRLGLLQQLGVIDA